MGDRALIVFRHEGDVSPVVYLHWNGYQVPELIKKLKVLMQGREGDVPYACARFIGVCHEEIPGNMSLGVWDGGRKVMEDPKGSSHGDSGVFVVDAETFEYEHF